MKLFPNDLRSTVSHLSHPQNRFSW